MSTPQEPVPAGPPTGDPGPPGRHDDDLLVVGSGPGGPNCPTPSEAYRVAAPDEIRALERFA